MSYNGCVKVPGGVEDQVFSQSSQSSYLYVDEIDILLIMFSHSALLTLTIIGVGVVLTVCCMKIPLSGGKTRLLR